MTLLLDICEHLKQQDFEGLVYVLSEALDKRQDTLMHKVLTSYGLDAYIVNGRESTEQALEWVCQQVPTPALAQYPKNHSTIKS